MCVFPHKDHLYWSGQLTWAPMQVFFFGVVRFLPLVHCASKVKEKEREDPLMFNTSTVFIYFFNIWLYFFLHLRRLAWREKKSTRNVKRKVSVVCSTGFRKSDFYASGLNVSVFLHPAGDWPLLKETWVWGSGVILRLQSELLPVVVTLCPCTAN